MATKLEESKIRDELDEIARKVQKRSQRIKLTEINCL